MRNNTALNSRCSQHTYRCCFVGRRFSEFRSEFFVPENIVKCRKMLFRFTVSSVSCPVVFVPKIYFVLISQYLDRSIQSRR